MICPTPDAVCPKPPSASMALVILLSSNPNMSAILEPNSFNAGAKDVTVFPISVIPWPIFLESLPPFFMASIPFSKSETKACHGDLPLSSSFNPLIASVTSLMDISPFSIPSMSLSVKPIPFKSAIEMSLSVPDMYLTRVSYLSMMDWIAETDLLLASSKRSAIAFVEWPNCSSSCSRALFFWATLEAYSGLSVCSLAISSLYFWIRFLRFSW